MKISDLTTDKKTLNVIKKLITCYRNDNKVEILKVVKNNCHKTDSWIDSLYNYPKLHEIIMQSVCELLSGYAVEGIEKPTSHGCGRYIDYIDYINMGDSYATTLFFDLEKKRKFFVSTLADVVEQSEK
jgi:hypothetical protein